MRFPAGGRGYIHLAREPARAGDWVDKSMVGLRVRLRRGGLVLPRDLGRVNRMSLRNCVSFKSLKAGFSL